MLIKLCGLKARINVATLKDEPLDIIVEFDAADLAAMAERFGLIGLEGVEARACLSKHDREPGGYDLSITVSGRATQLCGVSQEPMVSPFHEQSNLLLVPLKRANELDESGALTDPDIPEYEAFGDDGSLDIAEILAQSISLAIEPYPRREDAEITAFSHHSAGEEQALKRENPFAILQNIKDKS